MDSLGTHGLHCRKSVTSEQCCQVHPCLNRGFIHFGPYRVISFRWEKGGYSDCDLLEVRVPLKLGCDLLGHLYSHLLTLSCFWGWPCCKSCRITKERSTGNWSPHTSLSPLDWRLLVLSVMRHQHFSKI